MEIILSPKATKEAKDYGLTPEAMAFADLVAVGWSPEDAWAVAIRKGMTWKKSALKKEIADLHDSEHVQERIEGTRDVLTRKQKEALAKVNKNERAQIIDRAMSKENMLFNLQTALEGMKTGSKEWIDTSKMIVDVTRMKQDEIKDEDDTVTFHLPVRYPTGCEDCLYSRCDSCRYKKEYDKST